MTTEHTDFTSFGFSKEVLLSLADAGFKAPSPIQQQAIPLVMEGKDLIAQAQTGTGKTAAFGLPLLQCMERGKGVQVLVITPTRELASQVSDELFRLGKHQDVRTLAVYGGQSANRQIELVRRGAEIMVATPGRLLDHLREGRLKNFAPKAVVLDEADEMLDMGFIDDLNQIFDYLPPERQTLLFSATMPPAIQKLAQKILKEPSEVKITGKATTSADITQRYYVVGEHERTDAMIRLMESEDTEKTIVFCRTKREVENLANSLVALGYLARALHGDMEQKQREISINALKKGEVEVLVATDVAARGLDVSGISHVFNYHLPFDAESYVHRIGRTGRAGTKGVAITLVNTYEYKTLKRIQQVTGAPMTAEEVPSRGDLERVMDERLLQSLQDQPTRQGAERLMKRMEDEFDFDYRELAVQALSMLMERNEPSGPEQIGMSVEQVQKLSQYQKGHQDSRGKKGGYKGGYKDRRPPFKKRRNDSDGRPQGKSGGYKGKGGNRG